MDAPKSTPGPWRWFGNHLVGDHGHRPVVIGGGRDCLLVQRDPKTGRLVPLDVESPDARLVLAAPDLLEEAAGARTAIAAALHAKASPELLRAALAGLERAIAKAEGRAL